LNTAISSEQTDVRENIETRLGKVSIITPTFNRGHTISETLLSLQQQSYPFWECIVVDDGSTDNTSALLHTFASSDSRITFRERTRQPKGACTCRNIGVEVASGEFVMFLDSDDVLAPHCLQQRVEAFATAPDNDFIAFPALLFRSEPGDEDLLWNVLTGEDEALRFLRLDSPWQGTGPLWRRESIRRLGGWCEDLACWQDVELSLRGFSRNVRYSVRYDLPPDFFIRRGDGNSVSSSALWSREKLESKKAVLTSAVNFLATRPTTISRLDLRALFAAVSNDYARIRQPREAIAISRWALKLGVLSYSEFVMSIIHAFLHLRGINRLLGAALIRSIVVRYYSSPSTNGLVRYPGTNGR